MLTYAAPPVSMRKDELAVEAIKLRRRRSKQALTTDEQARLVAVEVEMNDRCAGMQREGMRR